MPDFSQRSTAPELMDNPDLAEDELRLALKDISRVNRLLGGNNITINAIRNCIKEHPQKKEWIIVDMGCGDGEMLRLIADALKYSELKIRYIGIDLNEKSIRMGQELSQEYPNMSLESKDILEVTPDYLNCDLLLCTLTMHHFSDDEIPIFLEQFTRLANVAVIINDLERSRLAYGLFNFFSLIFIKTKIAKHDGRVSISRAFKRQELQAFSNSLNLEDSQISWKWAFRYLWLIRTI